MRLFIATCLLLGACSAEDARTDSARISAAAFARPVDAHLFVNAQIVTLANGATADPDVVAANLVSIGATYVSGLVRIDGPSFFSDPQKAATVADTFNHVRHAVRLEHAGTRFDVILSGRRYATWNDLKPVLDAVFASFHVDAIFFDFFRYAQKDCPNQNFSCDTSPDVMKKAITYIHAHELLVGGNYFGDGLELGGTDAADFYALSDAWDLAKGSGDDYGLDTDTLARLRKHSNATILVHVNQNPQHSPDVADCMFMGDLVQHTSPTLEMWGSGKRLAYLQYRASDQGASGYRFMYDLLFPSCVPAPSDIHCKDHGEGGDVSDCVSHQVFYDAATDVHAGISMLEHMQNLASKY